MNTEFHATGVCWNTRIIIFEYGNTWPGEHNTENRQDLYVRVSGDSENEDVTPVPTAYMVYGTY